MSAALLLDELLSEFAPLTGSTWSDPTPAKAANPANRQHPCGLVADSAPCEPLRKVANRAAADEVAERDSQEFAAVRNQFNRPQSKQMRGRSQDSQDSQGLPDPKRFGADLAAVVWTDGDIARFLDRRARLLRWGWPEVTAELLAERLTLRDRGADTRVSCTECRQYRPGRCGNYKAAGLHTAEVGRDLVAMLQHCPGFDQ